MCTALKCRFTLLVYHPSPNPCPSFCVMQLAATLVNCVYTVKIAQLCRRLGTSYFLNMASKPDHNNGCCPSAIECLAIQVLVRRKPQLYETGTISLQNKLTWCTHYCTIYRNLSDGVPCQILGHRSTYCLSSRYNTVVNNR